MKRRDDNGYRAWRRRRAPRPTFRPNDKFLRAYEEAIILADCRRLSGPISTKALRQQAPGRYSVKLAIVLRRMARRGGPLKAAGGVRDWRTITPTYELQSDTREVAA